MCDVRNLRINGCIANYQQTRVYTLSPICSFSVNKFSVHFQKKVRMQIFPLVMHEVTAPRRDRAYHITHITLCVRRSESTSIHYAPLLILIFLHIIRTHHT